MSSYLSKLIVLSIFSVNIVYSSLCAATVIMTGNRIIYPANAKEKTVQFSNPDNIPYMVQIWTDVSNPKSKPETADGPFITTPQLFRIDPQQGQVVRLMFNHKVALPEDRESVFYFNFLQLPGLNASQKEQNKLVLLVTSRLKLFYRPQNLAISPERISEKIRFSYNNNKLQVINDSPYYVTFDKVELLDANSKSIALVKEPTMLAPLSKDTWSIESVNNNAVIVRYSVINDFGVSINYQYRF